MIAPDWRPVPGVARAVGRLRWDNVDRDADDVIERALHAGFAVREVGLPGWDTTGEAFDAIILGELWREHGDLLNAHGVSATVNEGLRHGRDISDERLDDAKAACRRWSTEVEAFLAEVAVVVRPTLAAPPPLLTNVELKVTRLTRPIDLLRDGRGVGLLDQPLTLRRTKLQRLLHSAPPQIAVCPQSANRDIAVGRVRRLERAVEYLADRGAFCGPAEQIGSSHIVGHRPAGACRPPDAGQAAVDRDTLPRPLDALLNAD